MLNPDLYIHAASAVAPVAPSEPVLNLNAHEPDYKGIIAPMQLRRMSKLVRMSMWAAADCLHQVGLSRADAVIMGTAFGCLADTELFLKKMLTQNEQMLTPTAFIQSTHNTPAGQIALATGCHGYNNTLSQQGHSFESAMLAAALLLEEHPDAGVLCGAGDELTPTSHALMQRLGIYCTEPRSAEEPKPRGGAIAGEGAGFFLLRKNSEGAIARISGLAMFHESSPGQASRRIQEMLDAAGGLRNTDLLLCGTVPDALSEGVYSGRIGEGLAYRRQSGAWPTDAAVALARLMQRWPEGKQRAWLLSHWGADWSAWLVVRTA